MAEVGYGHGLLTGLNRDSPEPLLNWLAAAELLDRCDVGPQFPTRGIFEIQRTVRLARHTVVTVFMVDQVLVNSSIQAHRFRGCHPAHTPRVSVIGIGCESFLRFADEVVGRTEHCVLGDDDALRACANRRDRKSTRLNSSHQIISYAVFCLKKKKNNELSI